MTKTISDQPSPPFLSLPNWMPTSAANQALRIAERDFSARREDWEILVRLATDPRMQNVWNEFTRRSRETREFLRPAKRPPIKQGLTTQEEFQAEAIGFVFYFAFTTACAQVSVTKPEEVKPFRETFEFRAKILREIADDLEGVKNPSLYADIAALRRIAIVQDQAQQIVRPPTDVLSIKNDRGDRIVRGVQISIANMLLETFGKSLHGVAATLTAVAIDKATSARVSRSAF